MAKRSFMKKVTSKRIREFETILLVSAVIVTGMFYGLQYTQAKLGNYVFQITAQPFLEKAPITHKDLSLGATKNLLMK
jgi:hypothetical protein